MCLPFNGMEEESAQALLASVFTANTLVINVIVFRGSNFSKFSGGHLPRPLVRACVLHACVLCTHNEHTFSNTLTSYTLTPLVLCINRCSIAKYVCINTCCTMYIQ